MSVSSDAFEILKSYSYTILVVDDNPANLDIISDYLKGFGFRILVALNGESALQKALLGRPDLILLDVLLPGIDGFETCRRLKANEALQDIPVIYMSALIDTVDKVRGFQTGAVDYLTKPLQYEEVLVRVKTHLALHAMQKQLLSQNAQLQQEIIERNHAEEALLKAQAELEQRVEKRTVELLRTNLRLKEEVGERRRAEEALRSNLQFLETLIDTIPSPVFYKDANGVYLGCNKIFEQTFKLPKEKLIGSSVYDLPEIIPPDLAQVYHKHDMELLQHPGVQVYEAKVHCVDDVLRDFIFYKATFADGAGKTAGIVGVMLDITERKRVEEDRSRLETAVEQAAEGIFITGTDGRIQYLNPAFEQITGYLREEVIGKKHGILKSGQHDEAFYKAMRDCLSRGEVWSGRLISKRKDGTFYDADVTISPVRDSTGAIINYVTVARDVTHEVQLEKQLQQAQKMEAMGTLASGIAHDFNNILSAIIGYAELTLLQFKEARLQSHLKEILSATNRAKDLVKQILTFSRKSIQELQPVQVEHIIKEALRMLRASLPSTIEINQNIESHSLVLADPTQIHQVLVNLCTNANHAMRQKGGVMEVTLADVCFSSLGERSDIKPGSYMRLTVRDTGHGMTEDVLVRIFDPFFTTKDTGEGTGLGLSVVHGIVKSLGGDITVSSEPAKGSTFNVFFPVIQSSACAEMVRETFLRTGSERILLVDDEPTVAEMGKRVLESLGYKVESRTSVVEALEVFRKQPGEFDLVITDQTMPHMTGTELAESLMQIRPDIPIILCSGYSPKNIEDKAKNMGIRALAAKPLSICDFAEIVRKVLDETPIA